MIFDRALRVLFSLGTDAVSSFARWVAHRLPDAPSGEREQPAQPLTTVADVVRGETSSQAQNQTIAFAHDGQSYEIDLDPEHAGELRSALQR